jgi:hypothetical protein
MKRPHVIAQKTTTPRDLYNKEAVKIFMEELGDMMPGALK